MSETKQWRRPKIVNIYLMQVGQTSIYKIGYTTQEPATRLAHIRFYVPDIHLIDFAPCPFIFEKLFHNRYQSKKVDNGYTEYFALTPEDVSFVRYFLQRMKNRTNITVTDCHSYNQERTKRVIKRW